MTKSCETYTILGTALSDDSATRLFGKYLKNIFKIYQTMGLLLLDATSYTYAFGTDELLEALKCRYFY